MGGENHKELSNEKDYSLYNFNIKSLKETLEW